MKVYLIGMPGSGKTTLGKQLAEELLMSFVDLDKEIEKQESQSIPTIFAERGEEYFRQSESQKLREWAGSDKSFVMATGGGAPCFHNGIEVINTTGLSIFLDVPIAELLNRIREDKNRPLLHTQDIKEREERLASLYNTRSGIYNQAKIKLSNPTIRTVLEALHLKK